MTSSTFLYNNNTRTVLKQITAAKTELANVMD